MAQEIKFVEPKVVVCCGHETHVSEAEVSVGRKLAVFPQIASNPPAFPKDEVTLSGPLPPK